MAQTVAYLEAIVGADITDFRRGMQDVRRETGILSDHFTGLSGVLSNVGRTLTYTVTAPLLALGGAAVKVASDFDGSMRNINSIALLTEDSFKNLSNEVLQFGTATRSGAIAASEGLYTVFSAGITDVPTAMNVMQVALKTAEAGLANLTTTTEGLTATALTFGDQSAKAMQMYSDATTLAVQLGVGSMETFNTGFANVMGSAAAIGDSFDSMSATLAFLTQRGMNAASAGTMLNNVYTKLMKPSSELSAIMSEMGVTSGRQLIETYGGITGAIRALYNEVGANEVVWAKMFPDVRGFKAVSRLFTAFEEDGVDAVSAFFDNFNSKLAAGGITQAAWEQQMMSFPALMDRFKSAATGAGIAIGQILMPVLTPLVEWITKGLVALAGTNPELLKLAVGFGIAAAAAGPLLWLIGSIISPIGLLAGAFAALYAAVTSNFGGIQTKIQEVVGSIIGDVNPLIDSIEVFVNELLGTDFDFNANALKDQVVESVTGAVNVAAGDIAGAQPVEIDIPIEAGTTLYGLYYSSEFSSELQAAFSYDEFVEYALGALGASDPRFIQAGSLLQVSIGTDIGLEPPTNGGIFRGRMEVWADEAATTAQDTIFDRLSNAFTAAWPGFSQSLTTLFDNVKTWIVTQGLPKLAQIGTDIFEALAALFTTDGDNSGETPVYVGLRTLFTTGISDAKDGIGEWFDTYAPDFGQAFTDFITNAISWIIEDGIPTVARTIGFVLGKVMSILSTGLFYIVQSVFTNPGEAVAGVGSFFMDNIALPLAEGAQDAWASSGAGNPIVDGIQAFIEAIGFQLPLALEALGILIEDALKGIGRKIGFFLDDLVVLQERAEFALLQFALIGNDTPAAKELLDKAQAELDRALTDQAGRDLAAKYGEFLKNVAANGIETFSKDFTLDGVNPFENIGKITFDFTDNLTAESIINNMLPMEQKALREVFGQALSLAIQGDMNQLGIVVDILPGTILAGLSADDIDVSQLTPDIVELFNTMISDALQDPNMSQSAKDKLITFASDLMAEWEAFLNEGVIPVGTAASDDASAATASAGLSKKGMSGFVTALVDKIQPSLMYQSTGVVRAFTAFSDGLAANNDFKAAITTVGTTFVSSVDKSPAFNRGGQKAAKGLGDGFKVGIGTIFAPSGDADIVTPVMGALQKVQGLFMATFAPGSPSFNAFSAFRNIVIQGLQETGLAMTSINTSTERFRSLMTVTFTTVTDIVAGSVARMIGMFGSIASALDRVGDAAFIAAQNIANVTQSQITQTTTRPSSPNPTSPQTSGRASGGPVFGGEPYYVGERGTELFVPNTNGTIIPNRLLRGLQPVAASSSNNTIVVNGVTNVDQFLFELRRRGIKL